MRSLATRFPASLKLLVLIASWATFGYATPQAHRYMPRKNVLDAPRFNPPSNVDSPEPIIDCNYPTMKGWVHDHSDKRNWLKYVGNGNPTPEEYNISTDYEKYTPEGVTRKVSRLTHFLP